MKKIKIPIKLTIFAECKVLLSVKKPIKTDEYELQTVRNKYKKHSCTFLCLLLETFYENRNYMEMFALKRKTSWERLTKQYFATMCFHDLGTIWNSE